MQFAVRSANDTALVLKAPNDGASDASPHVRDFLLGLMTSPIRRGYIPTGTYRLDSPLPDITTHVHLFGDSNARSVFLRNHNGTSGKGVLTLGPGSHGCTLSKLCLTAAPGTYGFAGLAIVAGAVDSCDRIVLDNILLSASTDLWTHSLFVDGSLKTSVPVGVRALRILECDIFGSNGYSVVLNNAPGASWIGGTLIDAGGTHVNSGQYQVIGYNPKIRGVLAVTDAG